MGLDHPQGKFLPTVGGEEGWGGGTQVPRTLYSFFIFCLSQSLWQRGSVQGPKARPSAGEDSAQFRGHQGL